MSIHLREEGTKLLLRRVFPDHQLVRVKPCLEMQHFCLPEVFAFALPVSTEPASLTRPLDHVTTTKFGWLHDGDGHIVYASLCSKCKTIWYVGRDT